MAKPPDVLFVCVHNAGRSQMAEAFFNQIAAARKLKLRAASAGTMPGDHVHTEVVAVMLESGIDLSGARPRLLSDELAEGVKHVITMGCQVDAEACPALFMRGVKDWGLPDPKGKPLGGVRIVRDEVRRRVESLIDEMAQHHPGDRQSPTTRI